MFFLGSSFTWKFHNYNLLIFVSYLLYFLRNCFDLQFAASTPKSFCCSLSHQCNFLSFSHQNPCYHNKSGHTCCIPTSCISDGNPFYICRISLDNLPRMSRFLHPEQIPIQHHTPCKHWRTEICRFCLFRFPIFLWSLVSKIIC